MLGDVLPLGNDFLNHIPRLIESLPRLLEVEPITLDGTEPSIDRIDSSIDERGANDFLTADTFQSLVAHVGEVIRRQFDGQWDVRLGADGRTSEPDIVDRHGRKCSLVRIYKEIQERGGDDFDSGNLAAFVRHTIRTHRT